MFFKNIENENSTSMQQQALPVKQLQQQSKPLCFFKVTSPSINLERKGTIYGLGFTLRAKRFLKHVAFSLKRRMCLSDKFLKVNF